MEKTEIVQKITDTLTKSLEGIVDEVKKKFDDSAPAPAEEKKEPEAQSDFAKHLTELSGKVDELSKKFASTAPATDDIQSKKTVIQDNLADLVKSMGIDPNNVDVDFVIKEKKKGTVDNSEDKFEKSAGDGSTDETHAEISDDELEKELSKLSPEEKSEALNMYFKSVIFNNK